MRLSAIILVPGLVALTGLPTMAAEDLPGVTVWRGAPGAGQGYGQSEDLTDWIRTWRNRALAAGVDPIPKDIHKRFRHAFPAGLFDWAHYRIFTDESLWRQAAGIGYGTGLVLVLDDVILFRTADAAGNHTAWYDGLSKAQTFRRHGVEMAAEGSPPVQTRHLGPSREYYYPYRYRLLQNGAAGRDGQRAPPSGNIVVDPKIIVEPKIGVEPANPFRNGGAAD